MRSGVDRGAARAVGDVGSGVAAGLGLAAFEVGLAIVRWPALAAEDLVRFTAVALLMGALVGVLSGAVAAGVLRVLPGLRQHRGVAASFAALAAAAALIDAFVYVNLYPDAHALLGLGAAAMTGLAVAIVARGQWRGVAAAVGCAASLAAVLFGGMLLASHHGLRQALIARTSVMGRTMQLVWPVTMADADDDCEWPAAAPYLGQPIAPGASVLLITIDAFRGDVGGERLATTLPRTMALLPHAARFDDAHAAAPRTTYSTYSMLTGVRPHRLGFVPATTDVHDRFIPLDDDDPIMIDPTKWKLRHRYPLGDQTPTLAGLLRAAGWFTAAVISDVSLLPNAGITREFEVVDPAPYLAVGRRDLGGATSEASTDAGIAMLQKRRDAQPFFMWLHYRDPHHPYTAFPPISPDAPAEVRYASELHRVDVALARLLTALEERGELARTIVVITGDHGEEFGDHGGRFHGTTLYEELVHVPLVVAVPGGRAGTFDQLLSLTDLAPTLLDLVGVAHPAGMDGQSFAGLLAGTPWVERPIFAYNTSYTANLERQAMVIDGRLKLIEDEGDATLELFDLVDDPGEQNNLVDVLPDETTRLRCTLWAADPFELEG